MSKLQLYITKSGSNYSSLLNLNPSEETGRYVRDISKVVELIDYDAEEKNVFYLLTANDEGTFFTIIRTVPPVKGHHIAEWIFIPANAEVDGDELYALVSLMTRKAALPRMTNADVAEVRAAFATEYAVKADAPRITACRGAGFAWRSYGPASGLTLRDFAGRGRWQQSYIPYAGVLLVDDELGYAVNAPSLCETPLGEPAVILPPEPGDDNFSAYVFNRRLEQPLCATLGEPVTITWRRNGFEDITVTEKIGTAEFIPVPPDTTGSHKLITPSSFFVTAQGSHTALDGCRIRVNGVDITAQGHPFTAEVLQHASVSVACDGYVTFNGVMDLAATSRALISLKEQSKVYCFELPLINSDYGTPVRFELHTKKRITQSPIDGYILLDDIQEGPARTNYLGYSNGGTKLTAKLLYGGIGFLVGIILMLLTGLCSSDNDGETAAPATEQVADSVAKNTPAPADNKPIAKAPAATPAAETKPAGNGFAEALKYLDANEKWTKAELEKYEATKGLFDDLNNYNAEAIYSKWGPLFKDSSRMQKIVNHMKLGAEKRKRKKVEAPFNKRADDTTITIQTYLNTVDP